MPVEEQLKRDQLHYGQDVVNSDLSWSLQQNDEIEACIIDLQHRIRPSVLELEERVRQKESAKLAGPSGVRELSSL